MFDDDLCHYRTKINGTDYIHFALLERFPIPINLRSRVKNFSGLTYESRAKWKMLWGIYSAIYGEVNISVEKCVEMKGDYVEK